MAAAHHIDRMKAGALALGLLAGLPGVAAATPADDFHAAVEQVPAARPAARPNRAALSRPAELYRIYRTQEQIDRITRIASQAGVRR